MAIKTSCIAVLAACLGVSSAFAQKTTPRFKVIAFYTGKADAAHISFVKEARPWFARMAAILSCRLGQPEIPHDLLQHGP